MPRILFVDDNKEFLGIASPVLIKAGYDVVTAENGAEAINKFNESSFDAVITDVVMPNTNGYELVKYIRDKAGDAVPVVIGISGSPCDINLSCFDLVLQKPFYLKNLIECLKNIKKSDK